MIPLTVYLFLLIELLAVSFGDLKTKKIPNAWSILNVLVFILLMLILPEYYRPEGKTLLYSLVFLFVGFILFLLRIMGGGDSKFLFSFYLLVPIQCQDKAFVHLLYSTMVIGTSLFLWTTGKNLYRFKNIWRSNRGNKFKEIYGQKFSFAPVILFSWVWMGWKMYSQGQVR